MLLALSDLVLLESQPLARGFQGLSGIRVRFKDTQMKACSPGESSVRRPPVLLCKSHLLAVCTPRSSHLPNTCRKLSNPPTPPHTHFYVGAATTKHAQSRFPGRNSHTHRDTVVFRRPAVRAAFTFTNSFWVFVCPQAKLLIAVRG